MHAASKGMRDTWMTFKKIWTNKETRKFLISYFIFEDGVNTVIVFQHLCGNNTWIQYAGTDNALHRCSNISTCRRISHGKTD